MNFMRAYFAFGLLVTFAWNAQVQADCGKPIQFTGLILSPFFLPLFTPEMIWKNSRPVCEEMQRAASVAQQHQSGGKK